MFDEAEENTNYPLKKPFKDFFLSISRCVKFYLCYDIENIFYVEQKL